MNNIHSLKIFRLISVKILLILLFTGTVCAAPIEQWNRTVGGRGEDWITSVHQTTDNGYILAGEYVYFVGKTARGGVDTPFSNSYAWLIKTDSGGNEQWNKTYLGSLGAVAISVKQTPDGGYIFAGMTAAYATSTTNGDAWIVKVDENGMQQWNRTFGGAKDDSVNEIQLTRDNGYIIAGKYGTGEKQFDAWLIRLDLNGNKIWSSTFAENEEARSVQQTMDGGYVFTGKTHSYDELHSNTDVFILKTDSNGIQQWRKLFGGKNDDSANSVQQTGDGGFIIAGFTRSLINSRSDADAWLIKTDASGNQQWERKFGDMNDDFADSVQQTLEGGYIFTGNTALYGVENTDVWLVKTDPSGTQQWWKTFGGKESDKGFAVNQTGDNGYILAGKTYSYGNGSSDAWLIKISGDSSQKSASNTIPAPSPMASLEPSRIQTPTERPVPLNLSPDAETTSSEVSGFEILTALAAILTAISILNRSR